MGYLFFIEFFVDSFIGLVIWVCAFQSCIADTAGCLGPSKSFRDLKFCTFHHRTSLYCHGRGIRVYHNLDKSGA